MKKKAVSFRKMYNNVKRTRHIHVCDEQFRWKNFVLATTELQSAFFVGFDRVRRKRTVRKTAKSVDENHVRQIVSDRHQSNRIRCRSITCQRGSLTTFKANSILRVLPRCRQNDSFYCRIGFWSAAAKVGGDDILLY